MRIRFLDGSLFALGATGLAALSLMVSLGTASATELKTIYSFCALSNCADGDIATSLMMDQSGTLYGTTAAGGDQFAGTAFALIPGERGWKYQRLYSFCSLQECTDGAGPVGRLVEDPAGNLYGATSGGGANTATGVLFELSPDKARKNWTYKVLYTFCPKHGFCRDGDLPGGLTYAGAANGLPYDGVSPLYGITSGGGRGGTDTSAGDGTVFTLTPAPRGKWRHQIVYSFCSQKPRCKGDGAPSFTPAVDAAGTLYGTAAGGPSFTGVVFEVTPAAKQWKQSLVHVFGPPGSGDGDMANGNSIVIDQFSSLLGATPTGGTNTNDDGHRGGGTIYTIGDSYKVLYSFCAQPACTDGEYPQGVLVRDTSGATFGTTVGGGDRSGNSGGGGVIYRLGNDGAFSVLYSFCSHVNCADGGNPVDGVTLAPSGKLYGVTMNGGAHATETFAGGTVFELTP